MNFLITDQFSFTFDFTKVPPMKHTLFLASLSLLININNVAMEPTTASSNLDSPEHLLSLRKQLIDLSVINMLKARGIQIIAEHDIADHLAAGPKTAHELAAVCNLNESALHRLLSMLSSHGIFTEDHQGNFSLTELSKLLISHHPYSIQQYAKTPDNYWWDTIRDLDHSIKTGESAFEKTHEGKTFWQALGDNPSHGQRFFNGMGNYSQPENEIFASMLDCAQFTTIVDVGGGQGGLIKALLARNPKLAGTLFDLDHVIKQVEPTARLQIQSGDFFKSVPAKKDAYVLKRVLLDWDNSKVVEILRTIRTAMRSDSKLFIIDGIISGHNQRDMAKDFDILMLGLFAGKHRTENDFKQITESAGLSISSIKPSSFGVSIIETQIKK